MFAPAATNALSLPGISIRRPDNTSQIMSDDATGSSIAGIITPQSNTSLIIRYQ
jgi:hypothetical protein